jgi:hypothetical protein
MTRLSFRLTAVRMAKAITALLLTACHAAPTLDVGSREPACGGYFPEAECHITFDGEASEHYLEDASFRLNLATDPTPDASLYQRVDPDDPYAPCRTNRRIYALSRRIDVLLPMAESCLLAGADATALHALERLAIDAKPGAPTAEKKRIERLTTEAKRRTPRMTLHVPMSGLLRIDDIPIGDGPFEGMIRLSPGSHEVRFYGGRACDRSERFIVREGEHRSLTLRPPQEPR